MVIFGLSCDRILLDCCFFKIKKLWFGPAKLKFILVPSKKINIQFQLVKNSQKTLHIVALPKNNDISYNL